MPRVLVGSDGWYRWSFPEGPVLGTGLFVSILDPWKMLDNRVADTRVLFLPKLLQDRLELVSGLCAAKSL